MSEESTTPDLVELVFEWVQGGKIARMTLYLDIDEARAAAERLAESKG